MPLTKEEAYGEFVDVDGTRTALDEGACAFVRRQLKVYEGGVARGAGPDPWLTTGQAAEELGVSRRTLTRIIDRGDIPCERYGGGHRRLRLSDVLRYKEGERKCREEAYRTLNELYFDRGNEDLDMIEGYLAQFE